MLEKIYSVFVSSTYEDLREERAEVQKALLKAKCFPIGMELFPSTDEETWEFIKRQIDDADFYLLVIGGRYGSTDADGISFTEKEYDYAREIKKPALAFIHANPDSIVSAKIDKDDAKRTALAAFVRKIQAKPLVSRYSNSHELGAQVLASIIDLRDTNKTAIGFVRGDRAADPKKYAEALEEIARLKSELSDHNLAEPFPEADQEIQIPLTVYRTNGVESVTAQITLGKIFIRIADQILRGEDSEYSIRSCLESLAPELKSGESVSLSDGRTFETIRTKMYGRNLIELDTVNREGAVTGAYSAQIWFLTDNGKVWYRKLKLDASVFD